MKEIWYYQRHMKGLQEVTMQEKETTQNILCAGLWWPTLHKDAKEFFRVVTFVRDLGSLLGEMKFP
jgi:hypothetical protein